MSEPVNDKVSDNPIKNLAKEVLLTRVKLEDLEKQAKARGDTLVDGVDKWMMENATHAPLIENLIEDVPPSYGNNIWVTREHKQVYRGTWGNIIDGKNQTREVELTRSYFDVEDGTQTPWDFELTVSFPDNLRLTYLRRDETLRDNEGKVETVVLGQKNISISGKGLIEPQIYDAVLGRIKTISGDIPIPSRVETTPDLFDEGEKFLLFLKGARLVTTNTSPTQ
jgi:hypothetical protein